MAANFLFFSWSLYDIRYLYKIVSPNVILIFSIFIIDKVCNLYTIINASKVTSFFWIRDADSIRLCIWEGLDVTFLRQQKICFFFFLKFLFCRNCKANSSYRNFRMLETINSSGSILLTSQNDNHFLSAIPYCFWVELDLDATTNFNAFSFCDFETPCRQSG